MWMKSWSFEAVRLQKTLNWSIGFGLSGIFVSSCSKRVVFILKTKHSTQRLFLQEICFVLILRILILRIGYSGIGSYSLFPFSEAPSSILQMVHNGSVRRGSSLNLPGVDPSEALGLLVHLGPPYPHPSVLLPIGMSPGLITAAPKPPLGSQVQTPSLPSPLASKAASGESGAVTNCSIQSCIFLKYFPLFLKRQSFSVIWWGLLPIRLLDLAYNDTRHISNDGINMK